LTFSGSQHFFSQDNNPGALAEYVRDLKDVRPTAPVGSRFQYTKSNFTLLARLVEVVTGMLFEQYVRERILMPLGMTRTCLTSDEAHDRAMGHRLDDAEPRQLFGGPR
jgi:CubicO group peptidase (beta-lactamase class C family)